MGLTDLISTSDRFGPQPLPDQVRQTGSAHPERVALFVLAIISVAAVVLDALRPGELVSGDWPSFFLPQFAFLGAQLRAGDIPGWNPYQFAGAPFAGDATGGWWYFPAMLAFAFLPPVPAVVVFVLGHLLAAGVGAYALGRTLGLGVGGALIAGLGHQFPWFFAFNTWSPVFTEVAVWLPFLLLATERAFRATALRRRLLWWIAAGLCLSQILVAWIGQGAYYAAQVFGAFLLFRALLAPVNPDLSLLGRCRELLVTGAAISLLALTFGAAGLLPRIGANRLSTVAGGDLRVESDWVVLNRGSDLLAFLHNVVGGANAGVSWYIGGGTLALALLAPLVARRWRFLPFFAAAAVGCFLLALPVVTPLHSILYLVLPRFEVFHAHYPARIMTVAYLAFALLAGATVDALWRWRPKWPTALAIGALPFLLALLLVASARDRTVVEPSTLAIVLLVGMLAAVFPFVAHVPRSLIVAALAGIVVWNPAGEMLVTGADPIWNEQPPVSLVALVASDGPATFLAEDPDEPARFAGFAPWLLPGRGVTIGYRTMMEEPISASLLVNNRATLLRLEDVQGYNPAQSLRYAQLIDAMNQEEQEYHELNLLRRAARSPILDMLNVRYLVVPVATEEIRGEPRFVGFTERYADDSVRILENLEAFPRAWLVHDAIEVTPAESLRMLAAGDVDPRTTVLLESAPPPMEQGRRRNEAAKVWLHEPNHVRISVEADAPAMLVVADSYSPDWKATVNGESAELYVANHALRAVAVPAGTSEVEMSFASPWLTMGLWISLIGAGVAAGALIAIYSGKALRWRTH